jgi:hypothetical protein
MKISKTPTNVIAIAARTGSEWDSVDFALLHIDQVLINELHKRTQYVTPPKRRTNV